jgi:hypothetical protein
LHKVVVTIAKLKGGNHSQQGEKQDLKIGSSKIPFVFFIGTTHKRSEKTLEDKRIMNRDQQRKNNATRKNSSLEGSGVLDLKPAAVNDLYWRHLVSLCELTVEDSKVAATAAHEDFQAICSPQR